jgi:hypothetical protein
VAGYVPHWEMGCVRSDGSTTFHTNVNAQQPSSAPSTVLALVVLVLSVVAMI